MWKKRLIWKNVTLQFDINMPEEVLGGPVSTLRKERLNNLKLACGRRDFFGRM